MSKRAEQFARQHHNHVFDLYQEGLGPVGYTVWSWEEMPEESRNVLILASQRFLNEIPEPPEFPAFADFQTELQAVLNRHNQEGHSNTPDFLLAEFITQCVTAFNKTVQARDGWYGVKLAPGEKVTPQVVARVSMDRGVLDG